MTLINGVSLVLGLDASCSEAGRSLAHLAAGSSWTSGTQYSSHLLFMKRTSLLVLLYQDASSWSPTLFH